VLIRFDCGKISNGVPLEELTRFDQPAQSLQGRGYVGEYRPQGTTDALERPKCNQSVSRSDIREDHSWGELCAIQHAVANTLDLASDYPLLIRISTVPPQQQSLGPRISRSVRVSKGGRHRMPLG